MIDSSFVRDIVRHRFTRGTVGNHLLMVDTETASLGLHSSTDSSYHSYFGINCRGHLYTKGYLVNIFGKNFRGKSTNNFRVGYVVNIYTILIKYGCVGT